MANFLRLATTAAWPKKRGTVAKEVQGVVGGDAGLGYDSIPSGVSSGWDAFTWLRASLCSRFTGSNLIWRPAGPDLFGISSAVS
jgi:hypothetical protein